MQFDKGQKSSNHWICGGNPYVAETLFCDAFGEVVLYKIVLTFRVCGENP